MLTLASTIKAISDHVSCDMAEEAVVLNVRTGIYYGLDPIGAAIWKLVQDEATIEQVVNAITAEYSIDKENCANDMIDFFTNMESYGLIEVN
ncbi:MAG: PqqD family protein [Methanothrix sp.]|nr:PqqD family protein [Methanothrix sp.]